jgi:hypothetical protein
VVTQVEGQLSRRTGYEVQRDGRFGAVILDQVEQAIQMSALSYCTLIQLALASANAGIICSGS